MQHNFSDDLFNPSGTLAFLADLNEYEAIPVNSTVEFDAARLDLGNG